MRQDLYDSLASRAPKKGPVFRKEGPAFYQQAFARNQRWAKPGPYTTTLSPEGEAKFRDWVKTNRVPFDPDAATTDYDMRGFWQATKGGTRATGKGGGHFTDQFKTPYDTTFSRESKYATGNNPLVWRGEKLINKRSGRVVFAPPQGGN